MNRRLQVANLIGVLVLVALCVVQWNRNRRLNLEAIRLEALRRSQEQVVADQTRNIQGLTGDLAQFKERLGTAREDHSESIKQISALRGERDELSVDTSQLKESLAAWTEAVVARDERLKEANDRILELGGRLDDSIQKFNGLATNYNAVVARLNAVGLASESTVPKP
jgi:chromosome segregation ATPase